MGYHVQEGSNTAAMLHPPFRHQVTDKQLPEACYFIIHPIKHFRHTLNQRTVASQPSTLLETKGNYNLTFLDALRLIRIHRGALLTTLFERGAAGERYREIPSLTPPRCGSELPDCTACC